MRLKQLLLTLAVCALSFLMVGCGGGGGGTADTTLPTITSAALVPASVAWPGGSVTVRVAASDASGIASVNVDITNSITSAVTRQTLSQVSAGVYEYSYSVAYTGTGAQQQTYTYSVTVKDNANNAKTQSAGQIVFNPIKSAEIVQVYRDMS